MFKSKDIDVGKLFSKHFKLGEHVEYLNKTKVGVAVGTPGRIGKLFSETGTSLPPLSVLATLTMEKQMHSCSRISHISYWTCRTSIRKVGPCWICRKRGRMCSSSCWGTRGSWRD